MQNEIVINADAGETRVAFLERSVFTELHIERGQGKSVVGNIVKGRVSRVLPGMQAAFVDIGLEKAAFLYVGDYFANSPGDEDEGDGPRGPRRRRNGGRGQPPQIDTVLSEGQEIVVQIAKEPIGTKGARITSNISIPGRHLVLTPWSRRVGVSRRIDSDKERRRLREIVDRLRPKELGFIIRTAGDGVREADLEADIRYLHSIWKKIHARNVEQKAPCVLHAEHDLLLRIIRDLANQETKRIVIDNDAAHDTLKEFVEEFVADPKPEIEHYKGSVPVFDHLGLEPQIHANLERKVWLKSGGSLIVDQCEALTAIDVNTGRFVGKRDLEETVFKTNLEAVKEVVHQLRFRNIGGLIIIDLIDMESAGHRDKVYRALQEALRSDKQRTNILKISELGLVEMTRKRTRENLVQTLCEPCAYCEGRGYLLSGETVAYNILREIRNDLPRFSGQRIAITVSPRVAEQLLGVESKPLAALSEELGREIEVRARPGLHQEQFEVEALDIGAPVAIPLRWLRDPAEIAAEEEAEARERAEAKKAARAARSGRGRKRGRSDTEEGEGEDVEAKDSGSDAVDAAPEAEADAGSDKSRAAAELDALDADASSVTSGEEEPEATAKSDAPDEQAAPSESDDAGPTAVAETKDEVAESAEKAESTDREQDSAIASSGDGDAEAPTVAPKRKARAKRAAKSSASGTAKPKAARARRPRVDPTVEVVADAEPVGPAGDEAGGEVGLSVGVAVGAIVGGRRPGAGPLDPPTAPDGGSAANTKASPDRDADSEEESDAGGRPGRARAVAALADAQPVDSEAEKRILPRSAEDEDE
jgi:ribonuclease G